jgi:serine/threonine protein kinase
MLSLQRVPSYVDPTTGRAINLTTGSNIKSYRNASFNNPFGTPPSKLKQRNSKNNNHKTVNVSWISQIQKELIITPGPPIRSMSTKQITPTKMKKTGDRTYNIDNLTLRNLIIDLIEDEKIKLIESNFTSPKNSLNRLFNRYKEAKSSEPQPILGPNVTVFSLNLPTLRPGVNTSILASGAFANVYNVKGKDYVLKQFKKKNSTSGIETNLLGEFYGCLMNANIDLSLTGENKRYFNQILQMYAIKEAGYPTTINLKSILEKCNGDLITFLEKSIFRNINEVCKVFNKLCKDCAMILCLLKKEKMFHRDIKPDNILYKNEKIEDIEFKIADFSTMIGYNTGTETPIGTNSYIGPLHLKQLRLADLKYSKRLERLERLEKIRKLKKSTNLKNLENLKKLEELEELEELDIGFITVFMDHLSDCYAMALTLFNLLIHLFNIPIRSLQYFPFTNDKSTFKSKIDIWSDNTLYNGKTKYQIQVELLQSFLRQSFQKISQYPELTEDNKIILERDLQIIEDLFLSNNPFPDPQHNMETETFAKIRTYLT